jgi:hypothetical protein
MLIHCNTHRYIPSGPCVQDVGRQDTVFDVLKKSVRSVATRG